MVGAALLLSLCPLAIGGKCAANSPVERVRIAADEEECLDVLMESLKPTQAWTYDPVEQINLASEVATMLFMCMPNVTEAFARLAYENRMAVFVEGLPTDIEHARYIHLAFTMLVGKPFQYDLQNDGQLVMELSPKPGAPAHTNAATGDFDPHTDEGSLDLGFRAHHIFLYGIENPNGTKTKYALTRDALDDIASLELFGEKTIDVMSQPRFTNRVPRSFGLQDDRWSRPVPILNFEDGVLQETRFVSYGIKPVNPEDHAANAAIALFKHALKRNAHSFELAPGCLLAFNNIHGAHMRDGIPNGMARLILRTLAVPTYELLQRATEQQGPIFSVEKILATSL